MLSLGFWILDICRVEVFRDILGICNYDTTFIIYKVVFCVKKELMHKLLHYIMPELIFEDDFT